MAENWKGPTAVIGILTILTTIGIFVYQELKPSKEPSNRDIVLVPKLTEDSSKLSLKDYEEKVGRWENKIDSINRNITLYNDSFQLKSKWISKTESYILLKKDILAQSDLPDDHRERHQKELDSLETVLKFENADTFRYQDKKSGLLKLQMKITDSLRRFKEFYKME